MPYSLFPIYQDATIWMPNATQFITLEIKYMMLMLNIYEKYLEVQIYVKKTLNMSMIKSLYLNN